MQTFTLYFVQNGKLVEKVVKAECRYDAQFCYPSNLPVSDRRGIYDGDIPATRK